MVKNHQKSDEPIRISKSIKNGEGRFFPGSDPEPQHSRALRGQSCSGAGQIWTFFSGILSVGKAMNWTGEKQIGSEMLICHEMSNTSSVVQPFIPFLDPVWQHWRIGLRSYKKSGSQPDHASHKWGCSRCPNNGSTPIFSINCRFMLEMPRFSQHVLPPIIGPWLVKRGPSTHALPLLRYAGWSAAGLCGGVSLDQLVGVVSGTNSRNKSQHVTICHYFLRFQFAVFFCSFALQQVLSSALWRW